MGEVHSELRGERQVALRNCRLISMGRQLQQRQVMGLPLIPMPSSSDGSYFFVASA